MVKLIERYFSTVGVESLYFNGQIWRRLTRRYAIAMQKRAEQFKKNSTF